MHMKEAEGRRGGNGCNYIISSKNDKKLKNPSSSKVAN